MLTPERYSDGKAKKLEESLAARTTFLYVQMYQEFR